MRASHRAFLLIVTEEDSDQNYYIKHYQHFDWPDGASGPTAGIGYDCGYATPAGVQRDWAGIVDDATIAALQRACGLKGQAAHAFVQAHRQSITISWDQALDEFQNREMPKLEVQLEHALPNTDKLSGDSFGALDSLIYNRGASFDLPGPRFAEMRAIKAHMAAQAFELIPNEFLSMRRLWPKGGDLWNRRTHEALLFRDGLIPPPPPSIPATPPTPEQGLIQ